MIKNPRNLKIHILLILNVIQRIFWAVILKRLIDRSLIDLNRIIEKNCVNFYKKKIQITIIKDSSWIPVIQNDKFYLFLM